LDLDAARVAERERDLEVHRLAAITDVLDPCPVDAEERSSADELDPAHDRGIEIVDDVRDLLDDACATGTVTGVARIAAARRLAFQLARCARIEVHSSFAGCA